MDQKLHGFDEALIQQIANEVIKRQSASKMKEDNRIDEKYIRETVEEFMKINDLKPAELGKVLSPHLTTWLGRKDTSERFFDSEKSISLDWIGKTADMMDISIFSLLRPVEIKGDIVNFGNHVNNNLTKGNNSSLTIGTQSS